jgi:cytochrome c biogenesis protein CcmG, thiol:disulfide interchange protein DsbE
MKKVLTLILVVVTTTCYGQTNFYKLFIDGQTSDSIFNEKAFNLKFKKMIMALPKDYSLTPIIFHKYQHKDSVFNYVTFKKTWWGNNKIDPKNFEMVYKQDPLYLFLEKKLPEFQLKDLNGNIFNSNQLAGKPTLINFWNMLCRACILEFSQLDKLREKYKGKVNFIAITTDDSRDSVNNFLLKKSYNFYHLIGGYTYSFKTLNISGLPINLFIDRNGIIREIKGCLPVEFDKTTGDPKVTNNTEFDKILDKLIKL